MNKPTPQELRERFFFNPPKNDATKAAHARVSEMTHALALELVTLVPGGRNLSLALTALEEVRMRANAAIAVEGRGEL